MKSHRSNPVLLAILLTLAFFVSNVNAQKIYLLVAGDTAPCEEEGKNIGPSCESNIILINNVFRENVPADQLVIYQRKSYDGPDSRPLKIANPWLGPNVSDNSANMKDKLLEAIESCPAGPNDTIVFAWFSHGTNVRGKHYLCMPNSGPVVARTDFTQALLSKNPRLAVFMTESCASVPGDAIDRMLMLRKSVPPTVISPLFESLFIQSRGLADFNSSTEPEFAMMPPCGGMMVLAMASIGKPYRDGNVLKMDFNQQDYGILQQFKDEHLSWAEFQKRLVLKTDEVFNIFFPIGIPHKSGQWIQQTQTPHFFSLPGKKSCCCDCNQRCGFLRRLIQRLRYRLAHRCRTSCCH